MMYCLSLHGCHLLLSRPARSLVSFVAELGCWLNIISFMNTSSHCRTSLTAASSHHLIIPSSNSRPYRRHLRPDWHLSRRNHPFQPSRAILPSHPKRANYRLARPHSPGLLTTRFTSLFSSKAVRSSISIIAPGTVVCHRKTVTPDRRSAAS